MSVDKEPRRADQPASIMKPRVLTWLLAWSFVGLGTSLVAGGCSVSPEEICNLKCSCEGCSQAEQDDCIADVTDTVAKAQNLGCSTQYSDWLGCVEQEAECRNGDTFAWDGCEIEEDALSACGGENPCTAAAKKLCDECSTSCAEPDSSGCTGRTACLSTCVLNATCDEIITSSGPYAECVAACP